jgi:hypothetical protein
MSLMLAAIAGPCLLAIGPMIFSALKQREER